MVQMYRSWQKRFVLQNPWRLQASLGSSSCQFSKLTRLRCYSQRSAWWRLDGGTGKTLSALPCRSQMLENCDVVVPRKSTEGTQKWVDGCGWGRDVFFLGICMNLLGLERYWLFLSFVSEGWCVCPRFLTASSWCDQYLLPTSAVAMIDFTLSKSFYVHFL